MCVFVCICGGVRVSVSVRVNFHLRVRVCVCVFDWVCVFVVDFAHRKFQSGAVLRLQLAVSRGPGPAVGS